MTWQIWTAIGAVVFVTLFVLWGKATARQLGRPLPEPRPLGERHNHMEGRCVLVYGRLGAGKTALVMQRAIRYARRYRLPLITNADVRSDAIVLRNWDELDQLELCTNRDGGCVNDSFQPCEGCHPGVIVLDEIHMWLPSQAGLMPTEQVRKAVHTLSYARKRGWLIFATTQFPTRVSTQFRYMCSEMLEVRPFSQGLVHFIKMRDPDTGKEVLPFAGIFFPRRARYNTRSEVTPLWER